MSTIKIVVVVVVVVVFCKNFSKHTRNLLYSMAARLKQSIKALVNGDTLLRTHCCT